MLKITNCNLSFIKQIIRIKKGDSKWQLMLKE